MMFLTEELSFEAAHFLTKYHGKCENMHGHSYRLHVTIAGEVQENGMVLDFGILKRVLMRKIISRLNHKCLNDIMDNPSNENLILWIWKELENLSDLLKEEMSDPNLPEDIKSFLSEPEGAVKEINTKVSLFELKLWETPTSMTSYRG